MNKKDISQVSSGIRSSFQKAIDAARKNNIDYAVEILKSIVQKDPGFMDARTALREQEEKKTAALGGFAKLMAGFKTGSLVSKGRSKLKKSPIEAMALAEEALAINLNNPAALNLLADAAFDAKGYFISIDSLEKIEKLQPKNELNMRKLAETYQAAGQGRNALRVWQRISAMKPEDLEIQSKLRSAAALASMEEGEWEKEGDYQSKLKNKEDAVALEQEDRIVRDVDDVAMMTQRYEEQIASGDESIDLRRKLAELYFRGNRFDDSINTYEWLVQKMGTLDPTIDKAIEKSRVGKYKEGIEAKRAAGASEDELKALEAEVYNYRMERAVDRVNRYPNDTELRYQLAMVYWEGGFIDNALEQFQLGQKNPHYRLSAMVHMGRCFHVKGQLDLSIEQFEKAISEMYAMDKAKMEALYYLGIACEDAGKLDKALDCFKQIYQSNVNYRDVSARIQKFYDMKKQA